MKNHVRIFFIFAGLSLFLFFGFAHSDNTDIVINEIGAYESSGNEWVEIFNRGTESVDLIGWKFWENNTNHALTLKQGEDFILEPGEFDDLKTALAEHGVIGKNLPRIVYFCAFDIKRVEGIRRSID